MPGRLPETEPLDRGDFTRFYEERYIETVRLAGFLAGDRSMSEDLAQDAFLRLQPHFDRLHNPGGYRAPRLSTSVAISIVRAAERCGASCGTARNSTRSPSGRGS